VFEELHVQYDARTNTTVQDDVDLLANHWKNFGFNKENAVRLTDEQARKRRALQKSDASRKQHLKQGAPRLEHPCTLPLRPMACPAAYPIT
jgi:hypothetical protein